MGLLDDVAEAVTRRGQDIMDLIRSGKADEVTREMLDMGDPVMNARLNEYLWNNYDLPMDARSRAKRASEMGFETDAYHGGASDLRAMSQFEGAAEAGQGALFSSSSPRVANTYAAPRNFADSGGNVTPLSLRSEGYAESGYTAPFPANGTQAEMDAWLAGVNRFNRRLDAGSAKNSYFTTQIDAARKKNASGAVIREVEDNRTAVGFVEPSDVFVSLDPTSLRSRFARFDPRLRHLDNLNAGVAGATAAGAGLLGYGDEANAMPAPEATSGGPSEGDYSFGYRDTLGQLYQMDGGVMYPKGQSAEGLLATVDQPAPEAPQAPLSAFDEALRYYLGPTGIPERIVAANELFNFVRGLERGMVASSQALDPNSGLTGWERVGRGADAATETLGALLGFGGTKQVAREMAPAIERGVLGVVDRLNQRGPMPTTYSNPIPGLMIGQHNLSPVGVKVASEIGGIPMPSLAIAKANAPLEKFGDVTLLAQPEMVLPSRNVNVWPNDAYTGRQPRGDVQFLNETTARTALKENPDFGHMRDATYWMDATNSMADADEMMKTAQLGVAEGIDPKKYSSMWDYVRDVRAKLGYQAYEDAPKMPGFEAYVDMERVLYPKELFTQSGNRKKPQPYTLDAVMKRMGSDKAYMAGSEGWDYGPGSFRAQVTPQFKTAAQVKSARGLLASGNEFEPIASAFRDAYGTIKGDIEQYAKNSRLVYEAPEAMTEIGRGGSANWFGDVPSEVRGYVEDLAKTARTMPTEYFEAKPKVAYSLADFPAALVPESAPQTADILRRAGVKDVFTYGPGTARAELIQRFPQLLFSTAGAGFPLGLLAMQPDEDRY